MIRVFCLSLAIALVVLMGLSALSARAETGHPVTPGRMSLDGPEGACFAVVWVINRSGLYIRAETLETSHGPVVIHYQTVGGHNATDFDLVDVLSLSDGVMADPMHLDLPDGETGRICLMEWIGG